MPETERGTAAGASSGAAGDAPDATAGAAGDAAGDAADVAADAATPAADASSTHLSWQVAEVRDVVVETPRVRSLILQIPGWRGHLAGQHVAVRLTGEDGYQALEIVDAVYRSCRAGQKVVL